MTPRRAVKNGGAQQIGEARPLAGAESDAGPRPDPVGPLRRTIRIINPLGLHHRVADQFHRVARRYLASVTVWNGDLRADGKSVMDLIMLIAMPDSDVVLEVEGPDAALALEPLVAILSAPSGEDYASELGSGI
jgi:phosphocarrier protein HPr